MINKHKYFTFPFILWLIIGAIVLMFINKGDFVLYFNSNRTYFGNIFFSIATKLAEWHFILLFFAILLYKKYGNAFMLLITWAMTGLIAQSLKRIFNLPRPAGYYTDITLNFITDNIHYHNSFPSGHTTTAFAIFVFFALITKNKHLHFLYFTLALSVAFSRIYLLEHFFIDVYFGSILGLIIGYFTFVFINKYNIFGFQKWKNNSIKKTKGKYYTLLL